MAKKFLVLSGLASVVVAIATYTVQCAGWDSPTTVMSPTICN